MIQQITELIEPESPAPKFLKLFGCKTKNKSFASPIEKNEATEIPEPKTSFIIKEVEVKNKAKESSSIRFFKKNVIQSLISNQIEELDLNREAEEKKVIERKNLISSRPLVKLSNTQKSKKSADDASLLLKFRSSYQRIGLQKCFDLKQNCLTKMNDNSGAINATNCSNINILIENQPNEKSILKANLKERADKFGINWNIENADKWAVYFLLMLQNN